MYNRYIPAPDGTYKKHSVSDPPCPPTPPPEPPKFHKPSGSGNIGHFLGNLLPAGLDTEDLIVVLLLLLISGDCKDGSNTALTTMLICFYENPNAPPRQHFLTVGSCYLSGLPSGAWSAFSLPAPVAKPGCDPGSVLGRPAARGHGPGYTWHLCRLCAFPAVYPHPGQYRYSRFRLRRAGYIVPIQCPYRPSFRKKGFSRTLSKRKKLTFPNISSNAIRDRLIVSHSWAKSAKPKIRISSQ